MALKIKNWHKFQHFKDRKPPWIKLYRDILDDILWHELDSDAAKCLVSFWLIASEHDGYLPPFKELAFRLRTTEKSIKSNVSKLSAWLEQDDISVISDSNAISAGYQETRLETETEKRQSSLALPEWLDQEKWKAYVKLRPSKARNPESLKAALQKLEQFKANGFDPNEIVSNSLANGWQGLFEPKPNGSGGNGGTVPDWMRSDEGTIRKGENIGVRPRPGEDMRNFRERVKEAAERMPNWT